MASKKQVKTSEEVISILRRDFLPNQIHKRKGSWNADKKAYDEYVYVEAKDITERLNEAFGLAWSLKLSVSNELPQMVVADSKNDRHVVVAAEIEYVDPDTGERYSKTGFGGKKITADLGNDFKGCLSKAMTNAAKKLGVAVDVGDDEVLIPEEGSNNATEEKKGVSIGGKAVTPANPQPREQEEVKPEATEPTEPAPAKKGVVIGGKSKTNTEDSAPVIEEAPKKNVTVAAKSDKTTETKSSKLSCADCSDEIVATPTPEGKMMEPKDIANIAKTFFKRELCSKCLKVAKEAMKKATTQATS